MAQNVKEEKRGRGGATALCSQPNSARKFRETIHVIKPIEKSVSLFTQGGEEGEEWPVVRGVKTILKRVVVPPSVTWPPRLAYFIGQKILQ